MAVDLAHSTMSADSEFTTFGVYVSSAVFASISDHLYEEAGVTDLGDYFADDETTVPAGDPAGEVLAAFVEEIVDEFAALYDAADFEAASTVDPHDFELLTLAADPRLAVRLEELFDAAALIQKRDARTVQTAILKAAIHERGLPDLPDDAIYG